MITRLEAVGIILITSGSAIAAIGAIANNIYLNHVMAMQFWRFSNLLLFLWAVGLYKKYWDGGLPAICLCGTYAIYGITNEVGLDGLWIS